MKKTYIQPVMLQVELGTEQIIADSTVQLKKSLMTDEQNAVNTSSRVRHKNVWDDEW